MHVCLFHMHTHPLWMAHKCCSRSPSRLLWRGSHPTDLTAGLRKHSEASRNVLQTMYGEITSCSSETESLSWRDEGTVKQTWQQRWSWIPARVFQATCKKFTDSLMTPPGRSRTSGLCAFQKICCKRSVS